MMDYFIYTHSIEGKVFYVGSSKIRKPKQGCWAHSIKYERAYSIVGRKEIWKQFVAGRKVDVSILDHYPTKEAVRTAELELIQLMGTIVAGTGPLVNIIDNNPVYQFSLDGVLIKRYLSVTIAAEETGINPFSIRSMCLNYGIRKTAGGFLWSYSSSCSFLFSGKRQLLMKSLEGTPLKRFDSIKSAAREMGSCSVNSIRMVLKGKQHKAYGHKWEMVPHELEIKNLEAKELGVKKTRLGKINK